MKKLLKYDLFYLVKTKKFLVYISIFVFFSILSPLTARYIGQILEFLLGDSGLAIPIPEATTVSAYTQYISDLMEICLLVALFGSISIFIRDKSKGLIPLIFTKPIDRTTYVISKYISVQILLLSSVLVGYLIFTYYTYVLFDEVFFLKGLASMGLYVLYLAMLTAIAQLFSTLFKSYWGASLLTLGIYLIFSILTVFGEVAVFKHLPGMVTTNIVQLLLDVSITKDIILTALVTLGIIVTMVLSSIYITKEQDL
jgi:ABC-2 type transport system permease protein